MPYEGFTRDERFTVDLRPEYSVAVKLLEMERQNVQSVITEALREGQVRLATPAEGTGPSTGASYFL